MTRREEGDPIFCIFKIFELRQVCLCSVLKVCLAVVVGGQTDFSLTLWPKASPLDLCFVFARPFKKRYSPQIDSRPFLVRFNSLAFRLI